jgi:uncharacterized protein YgiM (DUF1202 family)
MGVLVIVGAATGLSLVALAKPSLHWSKPVAEVAVPAEQTPSPAVTEPTPAAEPTPTPEPAPVVQPKAVTKEFIRLRKGPSTTTDVLAELQAGTTVILLADKNSLWQQVQYGNLVGYIYRSALRY